MANEKYGFVATHDRDNYGRLIITPVPDNQRNKDLAFRRWIGKNRSHTSTLSIFSLKDGLSDDQKAAFIEQVKTLDTIETVKSIHIGTPATTPDRPVIQKNYDVGLTVLFDSIEQHDVYQEAQVHLDFIENNKKLWESVVIYDTD